MGHGNLIAKTRLSEFFATQNQIAKVGGNMAMLRNDCTQALNRFALVGSIKIRHKQLGREEGGKSTRTIDSAQKVPDAFHIIIV